MKIISPFKDYYDSVGNQWHTNEPLFKRVQIEKTPAECPKAHAFLRTLLDFRVGPRMPSSSYVFNKMVVFFCGRWYPYWFSRGSHYDTVEGIMGYYETQLKEPEYLRCFRGSYYEGVRSEAEGFMKDSKYNGWNNWDKKSMQLFLERDRIVPSDVFIEVGAPYFSMIIGEGREWKLTTNPMLKEFFPKHFDAYTCFQEVSMYLGNQLVQPDIAPLTVGGDKVIAAQKGFDDMSFRTSAPGAKKLHREENRKRKRGLLT